MATEIRRKLEIARAAFRPVDSAARATKDGAWWSEGPLLKIKDHNRCRRSLHGKLATKFGKTERIFAAYLTGTLATCTSGHYVRTAQSPTTNQVIELPNNKTVNHYHES